LRTIERRRFMKKITAALIGAGGRGEGAYAHYIVNHPNDIQLVAVAEPDNEKRERVMNTHGISGEMCFHSWEELLQKPKLADAILI
jgi:predicted dehydrogenase